MSQAGNLETYWAAIAYAKRDLSTCESEPLQFCGAIQDHGHLLIWDRASQQVVAVSENCGELFSESAEQVLGRNINEFLAGASDIQPSEANHPREVQLKDQGQRVVSYHFTEALGYAELEPSGQTHVFENSIADVRRMIYLIENQEDEAHICKIACEHVRSIIDFERVMIYRFEPNWDGQVIGESVVDGLEPFQGLFYPASDIPPQARHLYLTTRYRLISDTSRPPVRLLTRAGLGRSEVDLSQCSLRASSPIHIEYLLNMGVRSSFSIPIKLDGKLWGLIACHHSRQARVPLHHLRSAGEMAAQVVSARITSLRNQRRLEVRNSILELSQRLLAEVTRGRTAVSAFEEMGPRLMELTQSQGVFVRLAGQEVRIGECPPADFIDHVLVHLRGQGAMTMWSSSCLVQEGLPAEPLAAGLLAVPFSIGFEDLLIWFRPEHQREVKWGGHPTGKVEHLQPRQSFQAWSEIVRQQSRKWSDSDEEAAQYLLFNFVQGIFENAADLARANTELETLTKAKDEFIGMISHELRTPLGVIVGWLDILRDQLTDGVHVEETLEVLERNAKAQINLVNDLLDISRITSGKLRIKPEANIDACALATDVVGSLQPTARARSLELTCHCEGVILSADADRLRQIIWNLVSNALKFTPKGGKVSVRISQVNSSCRLVVQDTGIGMDARALSTIFNRFSQVAESQHRSGGLGLGLSIVKSLVELHGGTIQADSQGPGCGSTFTVILPIYSLKTIEKEPAASAPSDVGLLLKGWKVLLAEDQPDAARALGYLLRRQGAVVETAEDGKQAFDQLKSQKFDLLLSDIGMPVWDGYELMQRWRALEVERRDAPLPAIALTAYASSADRVKALEAGFQNHIAKPVDRHELLSVLKSMKALQR